ncbi:MAG TPA: hypothetical protein DCE41_17545 [Cytophagales bacterium]|nr:hypothetical protein [Cytophagales bacterium]HAA23864.1 hypothetical protein [Cytophagales bacterium]
MRNILFLLLLASVTSSFGQSLKRQTDRLADLLDEVEFQLQNRDLQSSLVSEADVAWHLDHLLKVYVNLHGTLSKSNPAAYQRKANFTRGVVFATGVIPRGRAQAPASVRPPDNISTQAIQEQLAQARGLLTEFEKLDPKANYDHAVFGPLRRNQVVKFIAIHTHHHLKIVEDIVAAHKGD